MSRGLLSKYSKNISNLPFKLENELYCFKITEHGDFEVWENGFDYPIAREREESPIKFKKFKESDFYTHLIKILEDFLPVDFWFKENLPKIFDKLKENDGKTWNFNRFIISASSFGVKNFLNFTINYGDFSVLNVDYFEDKYFVNLHNPKYKEFFKNLYKIFNGLVELDETIKLNTPQYN